MFRFNFNVTDESDINNSQDGGPDPAGKSESIYCPVQSVPIQGDPADHHTELRFLNGWVFKQSIVDYHHLPKRQAELDSILPRSDLVPNVYEGGFKLWECSVDLVQYLVDESVSVASHDVLELGCGHGLPGIYAACHGASSVCLQDLNVDVLASVTSSNVMLNCRSYDAFQLLAGDWRDPSLFDTFARAQYDLVFSCDTLYSIESQPALVKLIERYLRVGGVAYIAAKSFYFGVGGSTLSFLNLIQQYENLEATVVRNIADGQSNVREIIRISKISQQIIN